MDYTTIFDASQPDRLRPFPLAILLLPLAVAVLFIPFRRRYVLSKETIQFWLLLSAISTSAFIFMMIAANNTYVDKVQHGTCSTIEGPITEFTPAPLYERPSWESFTVQNHRFAYSESFVTGAFNDEHAWGGLLQNGVHVRICFTREGAQPHDMRILKLEVQNADVERARDRSNG